MTPDNDAAALRQCLRDIVALATLPAIWSGADPVRIAESLAASLFTMLAPEFVYVSFRVAPGQGSIAVAQIDRHETDQRLADAIGPTILDWSKAHDPDEFLVLASDTSGVAARVTTRPIGAFAELGVIAAGFSREGEPTANHRMILNVAAGQATTAIRNAFLLNSLRVRDEQIREINEELAGRVVALENANSRITHLNETLEQKVVERTKALEAEMAERQSAEAALRQAQKLEAIGQLTGGVAHDFNNLLMIATGRVEILRQKLDGGGFDRELDGIERALRRGESLTRQLLSFSRRQPLRPLTLDLAARLPKLAGLLRASLRGDIELRTDILPDLWRVTIDPGEFELALLNLVFNARDALPHGGRLTISAHNERLEGTGPTGGLEGEFVAITVEDTGIGIPADVLPRVFEPFFTTKQIGSGTGLGLSQVYGFALQSGGTVTIDSTRGKGTIVVLYLPRSTEPVVSPDANEPLDKPRPISASVLLVEDNHDVAQIATELLESMGCTVKRFTTAREALESVRHLGDFDLVISDIVMPGGVSGLEFGRTLRARDPDLPILLMTGYSDTGEDARAEGFEIIPKPFRRRTLEEAIRLRLRKRQELPVR